MKNSSIDGLLGSKTVNSLDAKCCLKHIFVKKMPVKEKRQKRSIYVLSTRLRHCIDQVVQASLGPDQLAGLDNVSQF